MKKRYLAILLVAAVAGLMAVSGDGGTSVFGDWMRRLTRSDVRDCAVGPWGHVWYVPTLIEIPPDRIQIPSWSYTPLRWYLEAPSRDALVATLGRCGLEPEQIDLLLMSEIAITNGIGHIFQPPEALVLDLTPEVRARLYEELGRFTQNDAQFAPFRFSGDPDQEWLLDGQLLPEVKELAESLMYRHGKARMFSDLTLVLNRFPSPAVSSNLFVELSREATLLARVRLAPEDDVDELAKYWGLPDRQAEVRTLMKTMKFSEVLRDVSVTLLLPRFAKDHLYRYSRPEDPSFPSCHYTSMNFFNDKPDLRFTNLVESAQVLARDYVVVTNNFQLGDVILFMRNGHEAIHSCNYIADRIVFTRNGGSWAQPWMLTTLDALVDFYSYPEPIKLRVMRRRDLMPH